MTAHSKFEGPVFRPDGLITIGDVEARAERELEGTSRRDILSAFRCLAARLDLDLKMIPATPSAVRNLLGELTPGQLGVSPKRLANLRSAITRTVDRFGIKRQVITRAVPLSSAWSSLLARAEPKHYRLGLSRLATYCSAMDIQPREVCSETLRGLHDALAAESYVKNPRKQIKHTIALWNHCAREIVDWPSARLASPFVREPDMLPLAAFPEAFRADVGRWVGRMTKVDPLDLDAPVRPLRPSTIDGYIVVFRRFASALVRRGLVGVDEIESIGAFFVGDRFKEGLRHFLPQSKEKTTRYAHKVATSLFHVARHYVQLPEAELKRLESLVARLDPHLPRTMGARNRDRLEQFDDSDAIRRLLAFPAEESARAASTRNPIRRARAMERALAVSILIYTGLRIRNLRTIRLDRTIRRTANGVFLEVGSNETKNGVELTLDLPIETVNLLDRFLAEGRSILPGSDGPYLFPGRDGGPKSDNAMRAAVSEPLRRHAGLTLSPHLFRHIVAKIIVERNPDMYVAVSRRLGHRSINTTLSSYLGTETKAASRQINRLLDKIRDTPDLED